MTQLRHYPMPTSDIVQTRLIDPNPTRFSNFAGGNFAKAAEDEFAAMILSLASSSMLQSQHNITSPCTISTAVLV